MERVAFLIEDTGERLPCLLNPNTLVLKRTAGVVPRRSTSGALTGAALRDDPLLFTGGGTTEMELDLLFDVQLSGSTIDSDDVRDLTRPLWQLAENPAADVTGRPPIVRLVWGKSWNEPGVISAVAERLEMFGTEGSPQRSWMRMRMLRVVDEAEDGTEEPAAPPEAPLFEDEQGPLEPVTPPTDTAYHVVVGDGGELDSGGERIDQLAARYYGDASMWRLIASFNRLSDPARLEPGTLLLIPPMEAGGTATGAATGTTQ